MVHHTTLRGWSCDDSYMQSIWRSGGHTGRGRVTSLATGADRTTDPACFGLCRNLRGNRLRYERDVLGFSLHEVNSTRYPCGKRQVPRPDTSFHVHQPDMYFYVADESCLPQIIVSPSTPAGPSAISTPSSSIPAGGGNWGNQVIGLPRNPIEHSRPPHLAVT